MGRHGAARQKKHASNSHVRKFDTQRFELLGWGLFITTIGTAALSFIAAPAGAVFLVAAVSLAAFVLVWVFAQLNEGARQPRRRQWDTEPATTASADTRQMSSSSL